MLFKRKGKEDLENKERRIVSVAEIITRNKYKCGLCGSNVHNIRTCPREK